MESSSDTNTTISSSKSGVPESNLDSTSPKEKPCFVGESILKTLLMSPSSSKNFKQCFKYSFHNNSSNLSDNTVASVIVKKDKEPFQYDDQTNSISTTDLRNKFVSRNVTNSITTATSLKQVNSFINKFGSELVTVENIILKNDEFKESSKVILMPVKQDSNKVSKPVVKSYSTDGTEKQEIEEKDEDLSCEAYYQDEDSNECIPSLNVEVQLKEGHGTYNTENMEGLYSADVTTNQGNDGDSKSEAEGVGCDSDLRCAVCHRQFNFRKNMNKHMRHMHGIGRFTCAVCRAEFDKRRDLIKHRDVHSENGVAGGGYRCEDCGKVVAWYNHFVAHRRTHEASAAPATATIVPPARGNADHCCAECSKTFRSAAGLRVHQRTHTGEKPFACLICGVTFAQKRIQVDHMNKHTGARPYQCPSCPETFSNYITFNVHKRTRHNVTPEFACDICGAGFVWKSNLESHLRSHSREKVYECKECDRTFTHRNSLAYHKRVHAASLPFKCNDCPESFRSCSHLAEHRANKHNVQPQPCADCGGMFTGPASLARHRQNCEAVKKVGNTQQVDNNEAALKTAEDLKINESINESVISGEVKSSVNDETSTKTPLVSKPVAENTTSKVTMDSKVNELVGEQPVMLSESVRAGGKGSKAPGKKYPKKKSTAVRNMEATVARKEASKQALMIMITKLESAKRARSSEVGDCDSTSKKLKAITDSRLEKSLNVVREVSMLIAKPDLGSVAAVSKGATKTPILLSDIEPLSQLNLPDGNFLSAFNLTPISTLDPSASETVLLSLKSSVLQKPDSVSKIDVAAASEEYCNSAEPSSGTEATKNLEGSPNSSKDASNISLTISKLPSLAPKPSAPKPAPKSLLRKSLEKSISEKDLKRTVGSKVSDSLDLVCSKSVEVTAGSNYKPKKSLIEIFKPATKDVRTRLQILDTFLGIKTDDEGMSKQYLSQSCLPVSNPSSPDINILKSGINNDSKSPVTVPEKYTLVKSGNKFLVKESHSSHKVSCKDRSASIAHSRQNKVTSLMPKSNILAQLPKDLKETYSIMKTANSSQPLSISIPKSPASGESPYSPVEITIRESIGGVFPPLNLANPFVDQLPKLKEGNRGVSVIRKRRVNPSLMSSDRKSRKTKMNVA